MSLGKEKRERSTAGTSDGAPARADLQPIVHLIRNSLDYASWKHRKAVAAALRPIYTAATAEAAEAALEEFAASDWGEKLPTIVQSWR